LEQHEAAHIPGPHDRPAPDPTAQRRILVRARRIIRRAVERNLRGSFSPDDIDDCVGVALVKLVQALAAGTEVTSLDNFCYTIGMNASEDARRRRLARPWERTASRDESRPAESGDLFARWPSPMPPPEHLAAIEELGEVLRGKLDSETYARDALAHLRNGDITERRLVPKEFTSYKLRQGLGSVRETLTRAGFTCDDLVQALEELPPQVWDEICGARVSEPLAG